MVRLARMQREVTEGKCAEMLKARKLKYLFLKADHNDRVPLSGKLAGYRMLPSEYR